MKIDRQKLDELFQSKPQEEPEEESQEEKLDKPVAILVQPSPDPDCLGAAAGFSALLKEIYGLSTEIYHFGEISHPQNKSMKNVLRIPLKDGADFNRDEVSRTVVLDTDLEHSGFKTKTFTKVDVRIDHHEMERDDEPEYKDVRQVGSTCAIIWEYLKEFDIDLKEHADVATALVLGIKTDTLDFTSLTTSDLDLEAHRSLLSHVNKESLAKVTRFTLPREVFELEALAYKNKKEREGGTSLVSFIGELTLKQRDMISTIADRFNRMAGINTVVIMAVIDGHLQASVRSDDTRHDVGEMCQKIFGKKYSGAKEGSGGAKLPLDKQLEFIKSKEVKDTVIKEIISTFEHKIFDYLGEKESDNEE